MKPPTGKPLIIPLDPALIQSLKDYKLDHGIKSNAALAKKMGVSETYISRAFNEQFTGNKQEFEAKAEAMLSAALNEHRAPLITLSPHGFLVRPMRQFLATVQHTRDIGIAWCDAGKGKSCGIAVFQQTEPLCVAVTALKSRSGWRAIRDAILAELPQKRRQKNESWDAFLLRTFRGSGRLLIIDNAHLVTENARAWLAYDWHEQTGCGVALVGNPEIVQQWKRNDQHHSRVGLAHEVKPEAEMKAAKIARDTLELLLPEAAKDAQTLRMAEAVVKSKGAVRSLRKHANLARELMKSPDYTGKPLSAVFKAAHGLLLSDAKLEEAA